MTCLPAGTLPSSRALAMICTMSSPMVSERQVVWMAMISGLYSANMLVMACNRFAWPPKTAEPSVNELVPAITGSL